MAACFHLLRVFESHLNGAEYLGLQGNITNKSRMVAIIHSADKV